MVDRGTVGEKRKYTDLKKFLGNWDKLFLIPEFGQPFALDFFKPPKTFSIFQTEDFFQTEDVIDPSGVPNEEGEQGSKEGEQGSKEGEQGSKEREQGSEEKPLKRTRRPLPDVPGKIPAPEAPLAATKPGQELIRELDQYMAGKLITDYWNNEKVHKQLDEITEAMKYMTQQEQDRLRDLRELSDKKFRAGEITYNDFKNAQEFIYDEYMRMGQAGIARRSNKPPNKPLPAIPEKIPPLPSGYPPARTPRKLWEKDPSPNTRQKVLEELRGDTSPFSSLSTPDVSPIAPKSLLLSPVEPVKEPIPLIKYFEETQKNREVLLPSVEPSTIEEDIKQIDIIETKPPLKPAVVENVKKTFDVDGRPVPTPKRLKPVPKQTLAGPKPSSGAVKNKKKLTIPPLPTPVGKTVKELLKEMPDEKEIESLLKTPVKVYKQLPSEQKQKAIETLSAAVEAVDTNVILQPLQEKPDATVGEYLGQKYAFASPTAMEISTPESSKIRTPSKYTPEQEAVIESVDATIKRFQKQIETAKTPEDLQNLKENVEVYRSTLDQKEYQSTPLKAQKSRLTAAQKKLKKLVEEAEKFKSRK